MNHSVELDSEKYYYNKVKSELRSHRRRQTGEAVKTFILSSIIVAGFAMACLAIWNSPESVNNAFESIKAQGWWPL